MESGFTSDPGNIRIRMIVASVSAGICNTDSCDGTSEPMPRTCRSIEPRFTESVQTVPRSTVGAAGRSRYTNTVKAKTTTTMAPPMVIWRLRLRSLNSGRAISITSGCGNYRANAAWSQTYEIKGDMGIYVLIIAIRNVRWEIVLSI